MIAMTEAMDVTKKDGELDKPVLSEIKPVQMDENVLDTKTSENDNHLEVEKSLIAATRLLLENMELGKVGLLFVTPYTRHEYGPKEAVGALSNLGFKASFGIVNMRNISADFFH